MSETPATPNEEVLPPNATPITPGVV